MWVIAVMRNPAQIPKIIACLTKLVRGFDGGASPVEKFVPEDVQSME